MIDEDPIDPEHVWQVMWACLFSGYARVWWGRQIVWAGGGCVLVLVERWNSWDVSVEGAESI